MICPNGTAPVNKLLKMVKSKDYEVFFEPFDEPEDWDWRKNGIYRSPNITRIKSNTELLDALEKELNSEGRICYDMTDSFYAKHPYEGEEVSYRKEIFFWEYSSPNGKKYCYKITECTYLGEKPKYVPLCLECYSEGFSGSCFVIGSWERDKEGYEFRSVGSRMFQYICEEDLPIIWKAITEADSYLNDRFASEEKD